MGVELRYYRKFWRTLFTGPLGAQKKSGLLESSIVAQLGGSQRDIRDTRGSQRKRWSAPSLNLGWSGIATLRGMSPRGSQRPTGLRCTTLSLRPPQKSQQKMGKLVNRARHAAHTASLDQLPKTARSTRPDDPLARKETRAAAKTRYYCTEI